MLRTANGSENVSSASPGTSGRCSSTSCSPCTPLRPLWYTDFGTAALAAHCASKIRITGNVAGTAVAGDDRRVACRWSRAAYWSIADGSSVPGERPVPLVEVDRRPLHRHAGAASRCARVTSTRSAEADDLEVERHLLGVRAGERRRVDRRDLVVHQRLLVGDLALTGERGEHERQAVREQRRRSVHDVEVQVGAVAVAGVAEQAEHLAGLHRVADLHLQAAGLHVRVERVAALADVDDHVVAARGLDRLARRQRRPACPRAGRPASATTLPGAAE